MSNNWQAYKKILNAMVKPALGCTEPIAAAYAAALAAEMLHNKPTEIQVFVSDNLYKNAMGVYVPGTGKIGLAIAATVGALGGDASKGLEVLANIPMNVVDEAQSLIDTGSVKVSRKEVSEFIYCLVEMTDGTDNISVEIAGGHTRVQRKVKNGEVIFEQNAEEAVSTANVCDGVDIDFAKIYDYATKAPFEEIEFILEASRLNSALSKEGMDNPYGLAVGRTMADNMKSGFLSEDFANKIIMHTTAASDARMGGATLPAMSNFGSGNQGIAATMPVVLTAQYYQASQEQLARALIISHLGAIYIKSYYPPLSAFCGNTVTGAASAAAMVYLAGGTFAQSSFAIQNVLSDCAGMVCDGAKSTCAMKVKTATSAAINGFMMALQSKEVHQQGIVADDVERSIRNIGQLVTNGMRVTDATIIDIMSA